MPMVEFYPAGRVFCLHGPRFTYALQALPGGEIAHLYWGPRLRSRADQDGGVSEDLAGLLRPAVRAFAAVPEGAPTQDFSLDTLPQEFPAAGAADRRAPAIRVHDPRNGSRILEPRYAGHRIVPGKPRLAGLPATYVEPDDEAQTLCLDLLDEPTGLRIELLYTVFQDHDALARSARVTNVAGRDALEIERLLSASVDLPADLGTGGGRFLHLSGAWARERHVHDAPLRPGFQSVGSPRGASSHAHNPFMALLGADATEESGRVFGFSLVYSGNFLASVEVEPYGTARASIGIHPEDFGWRLEPGETFQTPEAVLVFSNTGLGTMSHTYHRLFRTRLCRGPWRNRSRPVLVNNWEATYFDFDADRIEALARTAADLGIELLALDDGWFGHRDDDRSSLGDWDVTHRRKLPGGLPELARRVNAAGLRFGLWFEPEMVSRDSELYRQHPDWCLHVPGRGRSEGRNQLILDFSRADVRDAVYEKVAGVLRSSPIVYVKWDMNRNFAEVGSPALPPERQREVPHRYVLGLYEFLERLIAEFPDILFESCSGGGGRFDPGMLFYMPQTWTSDNTDAVERLAIQHGTSVVYPLSTLAAHVSAVPNHQAGRTTPLASRFAVACLGGSFGYELDLGALTEEEQTVVRRQVRLYQETCELTSNGDFHRLSSAFEPARPGVAWMAVNPEKTAALVVFVRRLAHANAPARRLCLRGLDPAADYLVTRLAANLSTDDERSHGGDFLMAAGLPLPDAAPGDFISTIWRLAALRTPPPRGRS